MLPPPPHRLNLVFSVHLLYQMCREDTYHEFYSDVKVENHISSTYYYWQAASGNENHITALIIIGRQNLEMKAI